MGQFSYSGSHPAACREGGSGARGAGGAELWLSGERGGAGTAGGPLSQRPPRGDGPGPADRVGEVLEMADP